MSQFSKNHIIAAFARSNKILNVFLLARPTFRLFYCILNFSKVIVGISLVIELRYRLLKLTTSFGPIQPNVFSRAASGSGSNVAVKVVWISFCTAKK